MSLPGGARRAHGDCGESGRGHPGFHQSGRLHVGAGLWRLRRPSDRTFGQESQKNDSGKRQESRRTLASFRLQSRQLSIRIVRHESRGQTSLFSSTLASGCQVDGDVFPESIFVFESTSVVNFDSDLYGFGFWRHHWRV